MRLWQTWRRGATWFRSGQASRPNKGVSTRMLGRKISIKMILTDVFAIAIMLAVCDVFLIYLVGY